ncbi:MAG: TolC family protein [Deltaproteobacteria bacterium]|nr:TolC family protein [Deltaproteobacteria bacterium]
MSLMKSVLIGLVVLRAFPLSAAEEINSATEKAQKFWGPRSEEILILDLKECIHRAALFNGEIQAADYDIETAEARKDNVRKIGIPVAEYEYNVGPAPRDVSNAVESFFTGDLTVFNRVKVGVGVPLQTFGKVKTGKALADLGIMAEKEKKMGKKAEIGLKVAQLYNGILLAREVRRLIKTAKDELAKEIKKREQHEGGDPSELLKLKLFHAEIERRVEEVDKKEIMAKEALRVLIDVDPRVRFEIKTERLEPQLRTLPPYEKIREEALVNRSDLKQLDILYEVRQKKLTLEKRLPTPNLGIGAFFELGRTPGITGLSATDDYTDPFNYTRAGIGLRLKGEFDFRSTASKIREAKSELMKTQIQREMAHEGSLLEVKEAYLDAQNAQQEIVRAEEAGKLSRQLLFLTQSNYDIGLAEPKDFVDAVQSFLETRGKYFEALFNYNVALAKLDQKTGRKPE